MSDSINTEQLVKCSKAVEQILGDDCGHVIIQVSKTANGSMITFITNMGTNDTAFTLGAVLSNMDTGRVIPPPSQN